MAEVSVDERCKKLAGLISQSPPGEVNDVINDIRAIVGDDEALMPHVLPALREYNLAQLHVVEHAADEKSQGHTTLLSGATILPGSSTEGKERFVDAEGKRSFAFDHITLAVSDYEPYDLPDEEATFRADLYKSLSAYTKNHFASGYCSVSTSQYPLLPPTPVKAPVETSPEAETQKAEEETPSTETTDEIKEATNAEASNVEPSSTPAVGDIPEKKEEVDEPGGLEKVDEKVEEIKETEKTQEAEGEPEGEAEAQRPLDIPEEPTTAKEDVVQPEATSKPEPNQDTSAEGSNESDTAGDTGATEEPLPERKQERVENPNYTLEIVGNRYNPSNFWTGRWRTQWLVDQEAGSVTGTITVDVHYYEQGNVQLSTKHTASFPCPKASGSQSVASQIVTNVSKLETNYQLELNDVYSELGDKTFRALRRALPITRQKMDWEKVGGYTLGADLTKARA